MYRVIHVLLLLSACPAPKDDTGATDDTAATDDTSATDDTGTTTFTPSPTGSVRVCVTNDTSLDWYDALRFPATVVSEDVFTTSLPYGKCWSDSSLSRAIEVIDTEGVTWQIAWGLSDPDGLDVTPAAALLPGMAVDVSAGMSCGEGCSFGFSVSADDAVIVGADEGYWYPALDPEDLPGLTVAEGPVLGEAEDGCGRQAYTSIVFTTPDDTAELIPWEESEVLTAGVATRVWAAAASRYVRQDCTDLGDTLTWAAAR